eukprot:CAMPEP_0194441488 /NCGR_PEP_ID=MMETSP0176-20130528/121893_1 /TAXON_ID=216777 /ORGANISM="Proboscia alata, Strain PI-D3" /LENGTH=77 /DNA_ID=CAMNT_0039266903 /DNA_START=178 /DNA_END=408 /DNA_ORIENTATION=+
MGASPLDADCENWLTDVYRGMDIVIDTVGSVEAAREAVKWKTGKLVCVGLTQFLDDEDSSPEFSCMPISALLATSKS